MQGIYLIQMEINDLQLKISFNGHSYFKSLQFCFILKIAIFY